ncbi:MAG TPA: M4 family metallopeptidase [Plasticicumulans sp.]|nr:M4 family metallopeptidase [Plasticicumulans sp.]HNO61249.1 M4 family metallopeptidase [Plasticicumulans sp.]
MSRPSRPETAPCAARLTPHHRHAAGCGCFIIPTRVLDRFAQDEQLPEAQRKSFADAASIETEWRKVRSASQELMRMAHRVLPIGMTALAAAAPPVVSVFDCRHGMALPGTPFCDPAHATDETARRTFAETTAMAEFLRLAFNRNSLDDAGMGLLSSIHFSVGYNNAFWNGLQMTYGDGDGNIFIDFTRSNDVIAHELTHGLTEYTAGFAYRNQAGGLNESVSDVFGSMFRQWRAGQSVQQADWLIGRDIMGPGALARGYTCLRDLANPGAEHCLSPQPAHFDQYRNGMDPHDSSGIPNQAFYRAAMAIGGRSWEKTGRIWYHALTGYRPSPNLSMRSFANRTRSLARQIFGSEPSIRRAVDQAWLAVGL